MAVQLSLFATIHQETTKTGNRRIVVEKNGFKYIFPCDGNVAGRPYKVVPGSRIHKTNVLSELGIEMDVTIRVEELLKALEGKPYKKPTKLPKRNIKRRRRWVDVWKEHNKPFSATHVSHSEKIEVIIIDNLVYYRRADRGGGVLPVKDFHGRPISSERVST